MSKRIDDQFPESKACKVWENGGIKFSVVLHGACDHYCGYARLPKRPVQEDSYRGLLTYVPVHGGITYAEQDDDGSMVYGFDCGHAGDSEDARLRDMDWLKAECERMVVGIAKAAEFEGEYLKADGNEAKANVLERFVSSLAEIGISQPLTDNFGMMIAVLCGKL